MLQFFEQVSTYELMALIGAPILSVAFVLWFSARRMDQKSDAMFRRNAEETEKAGGGIEDEESRNDPRLLTREERLRRFSIILVLAVLGINLVISFFDKS